METDVNLLRSRQDNVTWQLMLEYGTEIVFLNPAMVGVDNVWG
jgi:hypothetical protein